MTDWTRMTKQLLADVDGCEPIYRPTNFWTPGLREILADLETRGVETFKSWPTAGYWFYPNYGWPLAPDTVAKTFKPALKANPGLPRRWWLRSLNGFREAIRDFDLARFAWDQSRWPFDLEGFGESAVGRPVHHYALTDREVRWGKPYLNYLLCLAALSRHVDEPPSSFLEIGGGFGVLGEIVMQRNQRARYVNLDIPPLVTVASYYLSTLFGDRVLTPDAAEPGPLSLPASACLPNWRLPNVSGPFDVFVNSFSFQEMEPHVVDHYVGMVADIGVTYVVSLNTRHGKPRATDGGEGGVVDPVTSDLIVEQFGRRGYTVCGRYGEPLIRSAGELVVLRRS
ncbi:putative sugar O-methyltransferase [Actinophytocola gossypii]|uniref:Sugar O-methyltransferase n=1 Tax=Actinophytocola gossypii TaxID=2812003 RepID=A0ABT2J2J9_9PSEU|nr:putative sugar O-methyltransferase [Actinophytocola gossypii]MCT2582083.1 putative sugar O-methyltransferase [Actinophytocola gossypii]